MTLTPRITRERISPAAQIAQIAAIQQRAELLDRELTDFLATTEVRITIQPSLTTAARNAKAIIKHLAAVKTLLEVE